MYAPIPWQNFVYFAMAAISLPLYLVILATIIHRRINKTKFTTTFYALIISLGIADLFAQITASFASIIRTSNIFNDFYWENRHWVAAMSYNCAMFVINLRFFGATLIAIQRYFVVCLNTPRWTEIFSPFTEKDLMGPDDMRSTIDRDELDKGTLMQNIWVLVTFSISAFCYLNLIRTVMRHQSMRQAIGSSKELRPSIVALGQAVAFTVMFSYYTISYILTITESPYAPAVRNYMTILTGAISYWNPWGIADLFSQVIGCFSSIIRTSNVFNEFYWENRRWVAPMSYNGGMFSINLRFFGATLIAVQRYFVVCLNTHRWTTKLTHIPFRLIFFTHWLIPFLYTLPILTNFDKDIMGPDDMRTTIDLDELDKGTLMQNIWVLITFSISAFCYINLIRTVMSHTGVGQAIGSSKELRPSVVALGQAVSFTVMFTYYTVNYILAITESPYAPSVRNYMTILTGAISYWNPWIYYFLNGDIRREVNKSLCRKKVLPLNMVKYVVTTWEKGSGRMKPPPDVNEANRRNRQQSGSRSAAREQQTDQEWRTVRQKEQQNRSYGGDYGQHSRDKDEQWNDRAGQMRLDQEEESKKVKKDEIDRLKESQQNHLRETCNIGRLINPYEYGVWSDAELGKSYFEFNPRRESEINLERNLWNNIFRTSTPADCLTSSPKPVAVSSSSTSVKSDSEIMAELEKDYERMRKLHKQLEEYLAEKEKKEALLKPKKKKKKSLIRRFWSWIRKKDDSNDSRRCKNIQKLIEQDEQKEEFGKREAHPEIDNNILEEEECTTQCVAVASCSDKYTEVLADTKMAMKDYVRKDIEKMTEESARTGRLYDGSLTSSTAPSSATNTNPQRENVDNGRAVAEAGQIETTVKPTRIVRSFPQEDEPQTIINVVNGDIFTIPTPGGVIVVEDDGKINADRIRNETNCDHVYAETAPLTLTTRTEEQQLRWLYMRNLQICENEGQEIIEFAVAGLERLDQLHAIRIAYQAVLAHLEITPNTKLVRVTFIAATEKIKTAFAGVMGYRDGVVSVRSPVEAGSLRSLLEQSVLPNNRSVVEINADVKVGSWIPTWGNTGSQRIKNYRETRKIAGIDTETIAKRQRRVEQEDLRKTKAVQKRPAARPSTDLLSVEACPNKKRRAGDINTDIDIDLQEPLWAIPTRNIEDISQMAESLNTENNEENYQLTSPLVNFHKTTSFPESPPLGLTNERTPRRQAVSKKTYEAITSTPVGSQCPPFSLSQVSPIRQACNTTPVNGTSTSVNTTVLRSGNAVFKGSRDRRNKSDYTNAVNRGKITPDSGNRKRPLPWKHRQVLNRSFDVEIDSNIRIVKEIIKNDLDTGNKILNNYLNLDFDLNRGHKLKDVVVHELRGRLHRIEETPLNEKKLLQEKKKDLNEYIDKLLTNSLQDYLATGDPHPLELAWYQKEKQRIDSANKQGKNLGIYMDVTRRREDLDVLRRLVADAIGDVKTSIKKQLTADLQGTATTTGQAALRRIGRIPYHVWHHPESMDDYRSMDVLYPALHKKFINNETYILDDFIEINEITRKILENRIEIDNTDDSHGGEPQGVIDPVVEGDEELEGIAIDGRTDLRNPEPIIEEINRAVLEERGPDEAANLDEIGQAIMRNVIYIRECTSSCPVCSPEDAQIVEDKLLDFVNTVGLTPPEQLLRINRLLNTVSGDLFQVADDGNIKKITVNDWLHNHMNCYQGMRSINNRLKEAMKLATILKKIWDASNFTDCDMRALKEVLSLEGLPQRLKFEFYGKTGYIDQSTHHQKEVLNRYGDLIKKLRERIEDMETGLCDVCLQLVRESSIKSRPNKSLKIGTHIKKEHQKIRGVLAACEVEKSGSTAN